MLIGIMQGRLSKKIGMPLQSFPYNSWEKEFERAKNIGFNQIEWLVDGVNDDKNPISSAEGRNQISHLAKNNNLLIKSICAHSFIDGNLLSVGIKKKEAINKLSNILYWASEAKIEYVILPVMDAMSIKNKVARNKLQKILNKDIDTGNTKILFESDLNRQQLKRFIDECGSESYGVLYDLGNATAMGFDILQDLKLLLPYIKEVHIKDRFLRNGPSARLGSADTSFHHAIKFLKKSNWDKSLILETPIFNNWKIEAKSNFNFLKNLVETEYDFLENIS